MREYRNAAHAFVDRLGVVIGQGDTVSVRGSTTRELTAQGFTLQRPLERGITLVGRYGNVAATVAETVWVLAGRRDVAFLAEYLPRARDFSDDGLVWRAGYGPRLRDWGGVDQLAQVRELLLAEPASRRAVVVLFDPAADFVDTRDVPCNNWLHFVVRNGWLDLSIAVRSNDLVWGFSGINAFEWSVVQELMASWLGVQTGRQHWYVSSLHVYERHYERAGHLLAAWPGSTCYEHEYNTVGYAGTWHEFPHHLRTWFELEAAIRADPAGTAAAVEAFPEPLLRAFLHVVRAHWVLKAQGASADVASLVAPLVGTDLGYAVAEMAARYGAGEWEAVGVLPAALDMSRLKSEIKRVHRVKSASYGDSWKRRGELIGVMANIARKVDRLENAASGTAGGDESMFDTLVDLFVYLVKYQTFLADQDSVLATRLFGDTVAGPKSVGVEGFEQLLASAEPSAPVSENPLGALVSGFACLHQLVEGQGAGPAPIEQRWEAAHALGAAALAALAAWAAENPRHAAEYLARL